MGLFFLLRPIAIARCRQLSAISLGSADLPFMQFKEERMPRKEVSLKTPAIKHALSKVSHCECRKLIFSFVNVLRKQLLNQGLGEERIQAGLKLAMEEFAPDCFATNRECTHLVLETLENYICAQEESGDILGRILFHFVFESSSSGCLVHDDGSEEDERARREFTPGIIPRPLMRYFLICVRGSVDGVDSFNSLPVLFGSNYEFIEQSTKAALDLAQDYRMTEDNEASPIYYPGFFLDRRVRIYACEFLLEVAKRMEELPEERLLMIFDNLQSKQRRSVNAVEMSRRFTLDDVRQLRKAVALGVASLRGKLQCDVG